MDINGEMAGLDLHNAEVYERDWEGEQLDAEAFWAEADTFEGDMSTLVPMTGNLIDDVGAMAARLSELEKDIEDRTADLKRLQEQADELKKVTIPNYFLTAGVTEVKLTNGAKVKIDKKFSCSPNKNIEDKAVIEQFLTANGMKDIMEIDVHVDPKHIAALHAHHIDFVKTAEVNTATLKSALREACGYGKSAAVLDETAIPNCIHFYKWDEAKVELPKTRKK